MGYLAASWRAISGCRALRIDSTWPVALRQVVDPGCARRALRQMRSASAPRAHASADVRFAAVELLP